MNAAILPGLRDRLTRTLLLAFAALLCLGTPRPAAAQICPVSVDTASTDTAQPGSATAQQRRRTPRKRQPPRGGEQLAPSSECSSDLTPPTVSIDPAGGTLGNSAVAVTIYWSDNVGLDEYGYYFTLNGVNVTPQFTYAGTSHSAQASATLTLQPGQNTLLAEVWDQAGNYGSATATYTYTSAPPPPPPSATPPAPAPLPQKMDDPAQTSAGMVHPGTAVRRDLCLVMAAGPGAAYECGDLRLAHGLPPIRVLNAGRAPALIYNSQHATGRQVLPFNLQMTAGAAPTHVTAITRVGPVGGGLAWRGESHWSDPAWAQGGLWRFATTYDASADPSGVYAYQVEVLGTFGGVQRQIAVYSGELTVVNRASSPLGAGWGVAGVEQRIWLADGVRALVIQGDGSTRVYRWVATNTAVSENVDRPDTLRSVYIDAQVHSWRRLPNGSEVWYDPAGRHYKTVTRLGHTTWFRYDGQGRLDLITLPRPAGSTTDAQYVFGYDDQNGGRLAWVCAIVSGSSCRNTHFEFALGDRRLTRIVDVDGQSVRFGYEGAGREVRSRTGRGGAAVSFAYDAAGKLSQASLPVPEAGHTIVNGFAASEGLGVAAAVPTAGARTTHDGPRTDVADVTQVWVNRWGAPVRVRSAVGQDTWLTRSDSRFPVLVTRVDYPGGRVVSAGYDARGNLEAQTDWSTWRTLADGSTAYATTRYARTNAAWPDFVTQATMPEGEVVQTEYDASGNRVWQQDGRGMESRVHFGYTGGQLTTVQTEAARLRGEQPERYAYDARGNLSRVTSPMGFYSEFFQDEIGRDTLRTSPVDANRRLRTWTRYDAMGLDTLTITDGDATEGDLYVRKQFDPEGNVRMVRRWSTYDPRRIGTVTRNYAYDAAGRLISESEGRLTPVRTTYDPAGNATVVSTGDGAVHTEFDVLNRPVRRVVPQRTHTQVVRDIVATYNGYVMARDAYPAFPNGAGGEFIVPADTTVFRYDPVTGAMLAADNRDAQVRRTYYPNGLLKTDTLRIRTWAEISEGGSFDAHVYALEFGYDLAGRRTWMEHPDAIEPVNGNTLQRYSRQQYGYHPLTGALASVRDVLGLEYTFHYNAEGALVETRSPGTVTETLTYDPDGRRKRRVLTSLNYNGVGAGLYTISDVAYTFDHRGMATRASDTGQDPAAVTERTMAYTQLGRLYDVKGRGYGSGGSQGLPATGERYVWDALGNRLEYQQAEDAYPTISEYFANSNRLSASHPPDGVANSGQPYVSADYDDAGNQVWYSADNFHSNVTSSEGTAHYRLTRSFYGADGRLRASDGNNCFTEGVPGQVGWICKGAGQLKNETSGAFEWYRYDALGRRVMVRTRRDHNCDPSACSSTIARFVWDGDQILYEIQAPGGAVTTAELENDNAYGNPYGRVLYTHGPGIDRPLDIIRMGHSPPGGYGFDAWGGPYPVLPYGNWQGSFVGATTAQGVKAPCDASGCLVSFPGSRYRTFLEADRPVYRRNWFGSLTDNQESGNGLMYMRNRYYNPTTGAFTQTDPIGLAGGLNTYGYAEGNPVTYSDPYGLCKKRDRICQRFVAQFRELARSTDNPNFDTAANILDAANDRVVFVDPSDRRLGGAMAATAMGCGFLGLGRCVYLRNDMGPGDQVAAVAHEVNYHVRYAVALPDAKQVTDGYTFDVSIQQSLPSYYQPTTILNRQRLTALGVKF